MTEPDEKRVDVESGMPATTSQEDIAESRRLNPQDESIEMNLEENDELVQPCAAPRMSPCRLRAHDGGFDRIESCPACSLPVHSTDIEGTAGMF